MIFLNFFLKRLYELLYFLISAPFASTGTLVYLIIVQDVINVQAGKSSKINKRAGCTGISRSKALLPHSRNSPIWSEISSSNFCSFFLLYSACSSTYFWFDFKTRENLNCLFLIKEGSSWGRETVVLKLKWL